MKSQYRKTLILILFVGLFFSIIWTYLSVNSHTRKDNSSDVTLSIIPDYHIKSGTDLKVWPKGTVLEQGMAAYFYAAAPRVTVKPVIKVEGMTNGHITGTYISRITVQSIDDNSQIYWSHIIHESTPVEFSLTGGNQESDSQSLFQAADISLDIPAAYNYANGIGDELLFQGGSFQVVVNLDVAINGTADGTSVDKKVDLSLPINLFPTYFTMPKTEEITSQVTLKEKASSPSLKETILEIIQINPIPFLTDIILLLLLLALLIANEAAKPKTAKEHSRFKEWITEGSVEIKNQLCVHILSLEGLVDLAIDLNKRVIYDRKVNRYYVLEEDMAYIYDIERTRAILDNKQQLGKLLLNKGLINTEQLEIGLYHQKKIGCRLGESLIALGFLDETTLYSTLASQLAIDYYELNPKTVSIDPKWFDQLNVHQAKALMSVPLGETSDKLLVVASSEVSREGIKETLTEILGRKIHLVVSKPSAINEILESIEKAENKRTEKYLSSGLTEKKPYEQLDINERKQFLDSYYRGVLRLDLFLKAMGLVNGDLLAQVPKSDNLLTWLSGKHLIQGNMANLIRGLSISVKAMDWNERQEHKLPDLADLLFHANYITTKSKELLIRETKVQSVSTSELLRKNFLASEETIADGKIILKFLESLIMQ